MKKNFKKFASLMLALVMAIGLAAPAFAADYATVPVSDITVSLQLVDEDGEKIFKETTVSVSDTATAYDLVTAKFTAVEDIDSATGNCSVWSTYGDSKYLQTIVCDKADYPTVPLEDEPDVGIDFLAWKDGYGLISYENGVYTYYYAGFAWTYSVTRNGEADKSVDDLTMNQYTLQQGDEVVLTYKLQTSTWTQNYPLEDLDVPNT